MRRSVAYRADSSWKAIARHGEDDGVGDGMVAPPAADATNTEYW
jgi:hypothetical protein